jgi:4-hydroxybenzoyl-CoA thioesterase
MTTTARKSFTTQLNVRFGDVDPAGIVYFPKIYDYIHEAFEELWDTHVGHRYYHVLSEEHLGFPLVHSEVDFKHPLHFGERPVVRVTCFKLGRSSIGLHYQFRVDDVLCVDAHMTVVCVEIGDLASREIPPHYRKKFEQILESA